MSEILIVGAGATGLMAGYKLAQKGKKVTVLEARNRTGGRIHTIENASFFQHAELGAEFIHGDLPITLALLEEAAIAYSPAGGEMVRYKDGKFTHDEQFMEEWELLIDKLSEIKEDISIAEFLNKHFPGAKYEKLRDSVWRFVSGYDTADPNLAGTFALSKEWQNEDEGAQHRLDNGYCAIVNYLANEIKANGSNIYLNSVVKEVDWKPGSVNITTQGGAVYSGEKLVIALPLGVLQAEKSELGAVSFHPAIKEQMSAVNDIGFGAIIKFLLEFDGIFWEDEEFTNRAGMSLKDMGFLFSDEQVPTWWTQAPKHSPLLTGWLGGLPAADKKDLSNEQLLQLALESLSHIFGLSVEELKNKLISWNIVNWTNEPFTRGSYSYDMIKSAVARELLRKPVENTLFFAGEYLYDGPAMGTVEAALTIGEEVAKVIEI